MNIHDEFALFIRLVDHACEHSATKNAVVSNINLGSVEVAGIMRKHFTISHFFRIKPSIPILETVTVGSKPNFKHCR